MYKVPINILKACRDLLDDYSNPKIYTPMIKDEDFFKKRFKYLSKRNNKAQKLVKLLNENYEI